MDILQGDTLFNFVCFDNTHPIEIGDKYIFFFGGIADVQVCDSENVKQEINQHNRPYQKDKIDLTYSFWQRCYKIKETNFDLNLVD